MELSFLRGLVAAVNPCAFVLLPTYLMYFLGLEGHRPGSQRATVSRALVVSAAVSAGFMSVFVVVGLITEYFTTWIERNAKYATLGIGVAFVILGVAMLTGYKLPLATPRINTENRDRTVVSMFVYGVAYAVASISCTIGLFITTLFSGVRNDGWANGVLNVAAYGAGMALIVTALTITLAVANTGMLRVLRTGSQYVDRIAAALVLLSGLYLIYYFWVVDINEDRSPITERVESLQRRVQNQLNGHWQAIGLVLGAAVVAAIVFVMSRRDSEQRDPAQM